MANRITQVPAEIVLSGDPEARISQVVSEAVLSGDPAARVSQVVIEVICDADPLPLDESSGPEEAWGLADGSAEAFLTSESLAESPEDAFGIADGVPSGSLSAMSEGPEEAFGLADETPSFVTYEYLFASAPQESFGLNDGSPLGGSQSLYGERPLITLTSYLDTGTERISDIPINHPSWGYRNDVLSWGTIKREIPIPPGPSIVDQASFDIADPPDADGIQHYRTTFDQRTQYHRKAEVKLGFEGGKESLFPVPFIGEYIPPGVFPPDRVQLKARAIWHRWLNRPIPIIGTRRNFPDLPEGVDEFDFPIIFGPHLPVDISAAMSFPFGTITPGVNSQGTFELQLCDTTTNSYALNQTVTNEVYAVYRQLPGATTFSLVSESEYTHVTEPRIIGGINYAGLNYIRFGSPQPTGTRIRADVDGMGFSGPIFSIPEKTGSITNVVQQSFGMLYYLFLLEPELHFDGPSIVATYEYFEEINLPWAGSVVKRGTTFGNVLAWMQSSAQFWIFPNRFGKIAMRPFDEPPTDRVIFDEHNDILGAQFIKGPKSTVDITPMQPEDVVTRVNARYGPIPATGQFIDTVEQNNEADQIELAAGNDPEAGIIPRDVDFLWARTEETALWAAEQYLGFKGLRSYRVSLSLDLKENVDRVELAQWFGVNYYGGIGGPWVNRAFLNYQILHQLNALRLDITGVSKFVCTESEKAVVSIGAWAKNSRVGPDWFGCLVYATMLDTRGGNKLFVLVHGDGQVFQPADDGVFPSLANTIGSFDRHRYRSMIHVATQELVTGRVAYHKFDMALRQWVLLNEEVLASNSHGDATVSMFVLNPSGQPGIWYQGDRDFESGTVGSTGPGYFKRGKVKWRLEDGTWSDALDTGDPDSAQSLFTGPHPYGGKVHINVSRAMPDNLDGAIMVHGRTEPLDVASTDDFQMQYLRPDKTLTTTAEFQLTLVQGYHAPSICGDYDSFEDEEGNYWIVAPILWGGTPVLYIWEAQEPEIGYPFYIDTGMDFNTYDSTRAQFPSLAVKHINGRVHIVGASGPGSFAAYKSMDGVFPFAMNPGAALQAGPRWPTDGLQTLGVTAIVLGGRTLLLTMQSGFGDGFIFDVQPVSGLPVSSSYTIADFISDNS